MNLILPDLGEGTLGGLILLIISSGGYRIWRYVQGARDNARIAVEYKKKQEQEAIDLQTSGARATASDYAETAHALRMRCDVVERENGELHKRNEYLEAENERLEKRLVHATKGAMELQGRFDELERRVEKLEEPPQATRRR